MAFVIPVIDAIAQPILDTAGVLIVNNLLNGNPAPPALPEQDWRHIAALINQAYPGYIQPAVYDANTVAELMSEVLARLGAETQATYFWELQVQNTLAQVSQAISNLAQGVNAFQGQQTAGGSPSELLADIGNLQAQLNGLATGLGNLQAGVVSRFTADEGVIVSGLSALATEVANLQAGVVSRFQADEGAIVSGLSALAAEVANLQAGVVSRFTADEGALTQGLTAEAATRAAQVTTVGQAVGNETSRALAAEAAITGSAIPSAVLQLQAKLQPQLDRLASDASRCLAPLCDTVTPNASQLGRLGGLLKGLEGLGIAALLAALVASAVADPEGTATAIADVGGWVDGFATELVNAIVG